MPNQASQIPELPKGIQATLLDYFKDTEYFTLSEANELVLEHQNRNVNTESIRARIYEGIDKGLFERVGKGLYMVTRDNDDGSQTSCLLINGDGRDLSIFPDNSVDSIITDHPWAVTKSLKGGNRNFADYELFQYSEEDFRSKHRILRPGHFLVEFLPEENSDNFEYLYQIKKMAKEAGLEYYATVPWKKGDFIANTGRKSKNTENVTFFTKGKARDLRPDAKKNKQYKESREIVEFKEHRDGFIGVSANDYGDSRTNIHEDIDVNLRLSVDKKDVSRVKELCEKYWWDFLLGFVDSPIKGELGYDALDKMEAQEYILCCLDHDGIDYVNLSFGPENIFESKADVIVNPTNLLGSMGADLAIAFKEAYPGLEDAYKKACQSRYQKNMNDFGRLNTITAGDYCSGLYAGDLYYYESPDKTKPDVLCFPTKGDWKNPSDLALIEKGLKTFVKEYKHKKIQSVCFPKIGCGLGGLNWEKEVKPLMQKYLKDIEADIFICGDTLRTDEKEFFMSGAKGMLPTVFDVQPPGKKDRIHQAEKPVKLLEQILEFITFEQDIVLDQFAGSGVLGEAALNTGRNSILIEKDEDMYQKIITRLSALKNINTEDSKLQLAIQTAILAGQTMQETHESNQSNNSATDFFEREPSLNIDEVINELEHATLENPEEIDIVSEAVSELKNLVLSSEKDIKVLECSSRGDRRFSALFAKVTIKGKEQSIEEWYQNARRTADGKKAGKGKPFDYILCPYTGDKLPVSDAADLYRGLWITYLNNHPALVEYASQFDDYSDCFKDPDLRQKQIENYNANPFDKEFAFFYHNPETLSSSDIISAYVKGDKEHYIDTVKCSHWYQNIITKKKGSITAKIQQAEAKATEQMNLFSNNQYIGKQVVKFR